MQTLTQIPKSFTPGESLERLAVGDVVPLESEQERVYFIGMGPNLFEETFIIQTIFRNPNLRLNPSILQNLYLASIQTLKQGKLGLYKGREEFLKNGKPEGDREKVEKEMEEYSKRSEFLNVYGDHE